MAVIEHLLPEEQAEVALAMALLAETGKRSRSHEHSSSPPMDILWLRLSRKPDDGHGLMGRFGCGHALVFLEREDHRWRAAFVAALVVGWVMVGSHVSPSDW